MKLTKEQIEELKGCVGSDAELVQFLSRLMFNYGGGEVLPFENIKHFLKITNSVIDDTLTVYIDTVRMLRLVGRSEIELLDLDLESTIALHDKTFKEYGVEITEKKNSEYKKSVEQFSDLTGDYKDIRIELISTLDELNEEGSSMNHCIATYHDIITNKHYVGFRVFNKKSGERLTLGCHRTNNTLIFNQLKGWGNSPAKKDSCLSIIEFCKLKSIMLPNNETSDLTPAFYN